MSKNVDISVIIPVSERYDSVRELYNDYKGAMDASGKSYEFIYVLDGDFPDVFSELISLRDEGEGIKVVKLSKWFGEATALTAGFEYSSADIILTLPAYYQMEPSEIPKILSDVQNYDMVIARRWPRVDSKLTQMQSRVFHGLLNFITETTFHDLGCSVRAFKRQVIDEIAVYGDQHRFLPVLAARQGFRIKESDVKQSTKDPHRRLYRTGVYSRRILDILTVFFLVKFTKKPLRFFGLVGSGLFALGGIFTLYLVYQRLFMDIALADRPALLLSSLLVVLGVQLFAMGLIGELIIFTHAKDIKEYTVEEIVN